MRQRLKEKDLTIELDKAVLDKLSEAGFDPVYGARPRKRTLQQLLENPLSPKLLAGEYMPSDIIKVTLDDLGHLVFQ